MTYDSGCYALDSIQPCPIAITFPGDKVYRFQSVLPPSSQYGYPIGSVAMTFTNLPGTHGTLEIDIGYINLVNWMDFSGFNPTRFRFTSAEGDVYVIDQTAGVQSITDRNQNTLTITTNGIVHSSGASVTFLRDAQGRIREIVDPIRPPQRHAGVRCRYGLCSH